MSALAPLHLPETPAPHFEPTASGMRVLLQGVRRAFPDGCTALDGLNLDIAAGSFVALVGPAGCGKSTLLRVIAGLEAVDAGRVSLWPEPGRPSGARSYIASIFRDAHLLLWRTALDNTALPLELAGVSVSERHAAARQVLARVGMTDSARRYVAELPAALRTRVALAQALVTRPRLLLLDEPFAALDQPSRSALAEQLRTLWQELGMTVLFATRSHAEAAYLAQRAIVLSRRPARAVVDRELELPVQRTAMLWQEPAFACEVRALSQALEQVEP